MNAIRGRLLAAWFTICLLVCGCSPAQTGGPLGTLEPGEIAPPLDAVGWLNAPDSGPGDLTGKVIVVESWATW